MISRGRKQEISGQRFKKGPRWPLQSNLNEPVDQYQAGLAPKLLVQG
jgi:hypothetical protein